MGTELFRQAFMAIDYLDFRFLPDSRRKRSIRNHPSSSCTKSNQDRKSNVMSVREFVTSDRGDVPGWVLVVLMTTGLVTAIWAVAAPRLNSILRNSLDSMNNIR